MAEALLKAKVAQLGQAAAWRISSAGTWAEAGLPAMPIAQRVMTQRGLAVATHRSRPIEASWVHDSAVILVMTASQREGLCVDFPEAADKVVLLSQLAGPAFDIEDPVGGDEADYTVCAAEIAQILDRGFERLIDLAETKNSR